MRIEVQTTRLFPKFQGAAAYRIEGLAARCDWVLMSDDKPPHVDLRRRVATDRPRHIFVSMRNAHLALRHFAQEVLPQLVAPFVLITGSEDTTVPRQIDRRWRPFNAEERGHVDTILGHPMLRHWFAENLDSTSEPLMSPLPLGLVFPDGPPTGGTEVSALIRQGRRAPRVLCAHRLREGPQWEMRKTVTALARNEWSGFCTVLDEEVPEARFIDLIRQHDFVLCVTGGGVDPSPKAWLSLLHGAVPIIAEGPLRPIYERLPVAIVPEWTAAALSVDHLQRWQTELVAVQQDPVGRAGVIERLGLGYWWAEIERRADPARG